MSYTNNITTNNSTNNSHTRATYNKFYQGKNGQNPDTAYFNSQLDESIIHINKYRFVDFYYEELDKLNIKYYQPTSDEPSIPNNNSIHEELSDGQVENSSSRAVPVNIPFQNNTNICRYRLDSLNNHIPSTSSSTPSSPAQSVGNQPNMMINSGLDFPMSPPLAQQQPTQQSTNPVLKTPAHPKKPKNTTAATNEYTSQTNTKYYRPSISHQTILKRVYDNYLCINIDSIIPIINQQNKLQQQYTQKAPKYPSDIQNIITATHDFISDQCGFLSELISDTSSDPFNLFNTSTIGLLFDRMHKSEFHIYQAHTELCKIINELKSRLLDKQNIKQAILDSAIGILKNTVDDLEQPGMMVSSIFISSLTEFIIWIYTNYQVYWMTTHTIQTSLKISSSLSIKFGTHIVDSIYTTLKKYFIPSYLFSISRTCWKFSNIHKREIARLRTLLIPPSYKNHWIFKCIEKSRGDIPWVFPDSPHIKNLVVFVDGRNCFYADEYQKTTGGVNLELLRRFLNLPDYHNILADLVYGRIASLLTGGRQLNIRDPQFVIPVIIFNERHRQQIQSLVPSNRVVIYTPRGQDDDLLILYLWLSNPGSFIASNDNYGNHAARLSQSFHESLDSTGHVGSMITDLNLSKYYEGMWSELTRCFKLINPLGNIHSDITGNHQHYPGTSAPF